MIRTQLLRSIQAVQSGDEREFNRFFKELYASCKVQLMAYATSEEQASDAFSEAICKFWKKFVVEGNELPQTNIKGYIFTMAKYYLIDQERTKERHRIVSNAALENDELSYMKTENDFWLEQQIADNYSAALKNAIVRLNSKCKKLFHLILDKGLEKPKDLWRPLGYNNARTLSVVKSNCLRQLKVETLAELERLTNQSEHHVK